MHLKSLFSLSWYLSPLFISIHPFFLLRGDIQWFFLRRQNDHDILINMKIVKLLIKLTLDHLSPRQYWYIFLVVQNDVFNSDLYFLRHRFLHYPLLDNNLSRRDFSPSHSDLLLQQKTSNTPTIAESLLAIKFPISFMSVITTMSTTHSFFALSAPFSFISSSVAATSCR